MGTQTFGNNQTSTLYVGAPSPDPYTLFLSKFTVPVTGGLLNLTVYGSGSAQIIPVVYSDNGGSPESKPLNLLAQGSAVSAPATTQFFSLPIYLALTAGQVLWFGYYISSGNFNVYENSSSLEWETFVINASSLPSTLSTMTLQSYTVICVQITVQFVTWQFQYWTGTGWMFFTSAQLDHIMEELSSLSGGGNAAGQEECVFDIPNTAVNRTIVQTLPYVQVSFNGAVIFPLANQGAMIGKLCYSPTIIEVTLYNAIFMKLAAAGSTVTQAYIDIAVSTIAAYICGLAGVPVGTMPSISVSITFNNANCFKAMQDLATACGLDYWGDMNGFNIGTRDSTLQTLGYISNNSKRGLDFSKTVDTIVVNGVSSSGAMIQGVAYSSSYSASNTGTIASFTIKKISDIPTLNNVAALKLAKLNNPSDGNSLECLTSQVAAWHPGQYVLCSHPELDLVGSYIIQRITKQAVTSTVEVDAAMPQMDVDALQQDSDTNDLSAYTTQPSTQIPANVNLQKLLELYHLNEGTGTVAKDSTPSGSPTNGVISGCSWITNSAFPGELFLSFGSSSEVDCPSVGNSIPGTAAFAIGGWFSPSSIVNLANLIGKANAYILETLTGGAVRFGVCIGGTWTYVTSPNGVTNASKRCFAMGVYDGTNLYLYVSDPSGVNQLLINPATGNPYFNHPLTGNVNVSTSDTYIGGSSYVGVIAECMIWGRALQAAEVQALFFQPLTQVY
jgi:hypothetical protein